ncbi:hypothetical protein [Roseobacter ponti]|uniref:DUF4956 domain-containing protein n=1 Tax=Roseobacter ponti TaxID=1891787 RepID=A0A858SNC5_9RHOB|nr:hypothetical protein [Roseobacter ponti]QJF50314.1 hypothetical protein G3256_03605 [Roseobacter ponti]
MKLRIVLFSVFACAVPMIAQAQMLPGTESMAMPAQVDITAGGWGQIRDLDELITFGMYVLTTVILTWAIVFHPVRQASRRTLDDLLMPRLFFLYALIGMAVGFLVIQHGYIIGFVVFGIGALLRFRSNLEDPVDTVEMILVTVIGLAIGLDLPVMAILLAIVAWVFIWIGGRTKGVEVSLKADSEPDVMEAFRLLKEATSGPGWKVIHQKHVAGKTGITVVYQVSGSLSEQEIETLLTDAVPAGTECKIRL